ncbi:hypothetical protein B0J18DRAFT_303199 [Chaetomium sp. MPI-SDFR-AT-0129]|nr:hypothetical protein B0J18DRAFT_303199 [Chaetomium sp. MPI-SDFR-AT-0129]
MGDANKANREGSLANPAHRHTANPMRPKLPSRANSSTIIVPRDSTEVGPVDPHVGPSGVRAMSPRRTSEDIQTLCKEIREAREHAEALQDLWHILASRIEAVKTQHDMLDHENKLLQELIKDLMSTGQNQK